MLLKSSDITGSSKGPAVIGILTQKGLLELPCNVEVERIAEPELIKVMKGQNIKEDGEIEFNVTLKFTTKEAIILPWSPKGDAVLVIDWDSLKALS